MFEFLKKKFSSKRDHPKIQINYSKDNNSELSEEKTPEKTKIKEEDFMEIPIVEIAPLNNQQISRGVKDRLSTNLQYNLQKIRERITSSDLIFEQMKVGSNYEKKVIISYLKNIANPDLVKEIKDRINKIKVASILDSSYIERGIEDSNLSPFPQVEITSRPDTVESAILQGRIVIILEGSSNLLLAPTTFFDLMDTPEDAFRRWPFASNFFRMARYLMFLFAMCLPGFYIALTSFNIEMIPTRLLTIMLASRQNAILPIYFEAFLMMGVVEAVRMIMLRMPGQLGSTIALFAGVTLIGAGITGDMVGTPIVIIVTLTIISSYAIPNIDLRSSIRIIQFFTMIMSTLLGMFGFAVAFFYVCVHLVTLKSFGIPYMAPLAPIEGSGWGQTILRRTTNKMPQDETYKPQKYANKHKTKKLDPKMLGVFLIVALFEIDFAAAPREVVSIAGEDAWLSMILGAILVIITSIVLVKLASLFPNENFFSYSRKVWGKPLGSLINIAYIIFWFFFISIVLQDTAAINQALFLPTTPSIVPLLLILIGIICLVSYGITNVIRLFQVMLPFIIIPLIFVLVLTLRSIDSTNFFPFLSNGILPVLKGVLVFLGAWQGLEVILFLAPFISNINKTYIPVIISISFTMFLLISIATGSIGIMGVENIKETVVPSISMLSLIELPGFPVERFGLLLTLPVILGVFTTLAIYIYLISFSLIEKFKIDHRKIVISLVAILTLTTIYLVPDLAWTIMLREILVYMTILFILVIPVFTLILAKVRGRGELK